MKEKCEHCGKYNCICNESKKDGKHDHEHYEKEIHAHDHNHEHNHNHNHGHNHNHEHGCCGHCHSGHDEHHHGTENSKINVFKYIASVILFLVSIFIVPENLKIITFAITILLAGLETLVTGIKNIFKLDFEETTLMAIAIIAAFILGEYTESAMVVLLARIGEFLEDRTLSKSQKSVREISEIKENNANLIIDDSNNTEKVSASEIKVGDKILIKPGERVPLDCIVLSGKTKIDTSVITGESDLRKVEKGNKILSGSINSNGAIICQVEKNLENSTASQIVNLVNEAITNKGKMENFITKFSRIYTPIVMIIALIIAILPATLGVYTYKIWIKRSLIFLVASCPCSIVISIPLAMFAGVGVMAKRGLLVKGTKHIESLAKADVVCFDKTGTLTTGKKEVNTFNITEGFNKHEVIKYMVSLESLSNHPVSYAILNFAKDIQKESVENYKEISGKGLYGEIDGKELLLGNSKLLDEYDIKKEKENKGTLYLVINKKVAAILSLKEEVEEGNKDIVKALDKCGIKKSIMLTGDNKIEAEEIGNELGIKEIYSELLPAEKQTKIKELKKDSKVIFVGDGINDGPVLATSDFGISMGKGTEIANNVSDSILISNKISIIPECIKDAKKTMGIVKFNIAFSLIVKFIVLALGVVGIAPMWSAVIADTGVSSLTILNAIRVYRK